MTSRPLVKVYQGTGHNSKKIYPLPSVFLTPLRPDLVKDVFTNMSKNRRQPYAVSKLAGHQTSAESWGTGRAVARIPRVPGGGTHRAGQGAFGNMCRGGRMFAPTKTWRRWHRRINLNQKRYAAASALAASGITSLVMARGHRIDHVKEIPLVIDQRSFRHMTKTKQAVKLLKGIGAYEDIEKVKASRQIRRGKGKSRNRRHVQRRGPLVIYRRKTRLVNAFRNIPGLDLCCVDRLNLLQLAPGGQLGRFIIWVDDAFGQLYRLFGSFGTPSKVKLGFRLPRPVMQNADVTRIVNSHEIQKVVRKPNSRRKPRYVKKKNALKNRGFMIKLNPYEKNRLRKIFREKELKKNEKQLAIEKRRSDFLKKKKKAAKKRRKPYYQALLANPTIYEVNAPPAKPTED